MWLTDLLPAGSFMFSVKIVESLTGLDGWEGPSGSSSSNLLP